MLYNIAQRNGIPHRAIGKLIVASTQQEASQVEQIHRKASRLGVETRLVDSDELARLEPNVA